MQRRLLMMAGVPLAFAAARLAAEAPPEVRIGAKKFEFHPTEVTVRLGQPVLLVLTSEDRIHGFKIPDLGIRTDMIPGQETRLAFTPSNAGRFTFFCDIFCGEGHDEMDGTLIVEA